MDDFIAAFATFGRCAAIETVVSPRVAAQPAAVSTSAACDLPANSGSPQA
jgi:hypothetical protein